MLDLDSVRAAFPGLASGFVFLDNAGGSQTLGLVAERITDYLLYTNVQIGASYAVSVAAAERVSAAVRATAAFTNAEDPSEIVFGSSTTQLVANLALAMEPGLAPGDEIVVTEADHHANVGPWARLAARGLIVRTWVLDRETLRLEVRDLLPLLTKRTKLVAFPHVSNLLGTIHDVAEITRVVHANGARVCVDGVAYAPHRAIDVRAWDVDYYVFSFYKVYGPHVAVLYGKRAALDQLATVNHEFITATPYRLQPGNLNFELAHGVTGVYDYLDQVGGFSPIAAHEQELAEPLLEFLGSRPRVTIHGARSADLSVRVPTISFTVADMSAESVVRRVDPHGIGIRHGDFYARGVVRSLGVDSVVRISMVHYNTHAEIERVIGVLAHIL